MGRPTVALGNSGFVRALSQFCSFFFFFFFFNVSLMFNLEREREEEEQRERKVQNHNQAPSSELSTQSPTWGSSSQTVRS